MKEFLRRSTLILILAVSLIFLLSGAESFAGFKAPALTLIYILITYFLAKAIIGRYWALLPVFFLAFSPTVLGFGQSSLLATASALAFSLTAISFTEILSSKSRAITAIAGISFGLALTISWKALIFIPYLAVITIAFYLGTKRNQILRSLTTLLIGVTCAVLIAYITNASLSDYISQTITGIEESINIISFNLPFVFLVKESTVALIAIMVSLCISLKACARSIYAILFRKSKIWKEYLNTRFAEFSLTVFIIIWLRLMTIVKAEAAMSDFLPILPAIYILTCGVVKKWFNLDEIKKIRDVVLRIFTFGHELRNLLVKSLGLITFIVWYLSSAFYAAPEFLNYHNTLYFAYLVFK